MAIHKCGRGFELRTTENKSSWRSERDLNSGPSNCKSSALTARPRCLLTCLTTLLQNDDEYRCARFSILIKPVQQQIRLLTGLNVGAKRAPSLLNSLNKLHLFVARFTEALTVRPKQFCIYCSLQASKRLNKSNSFQYNRGGGGAFI